MTALYNTAEIRGIETTFATTHSRVSLMLRAGTAVAALAIRLIAQHKVKKSVLIMAGPGNNGGDAWVAARLLQQKKINVTVLALGEEKQKDPAAKKAQAEYVKAKGVVLKAAPAQRLHARPSAEFGLIIDGIFGIGLSKKPDAEFARAIHIANGLHEKYGTPILAIDVPSGLSADTGSAPGEVIHATTTLTFLGAKPGLYTADGTDCCGEIFIDSLGVELPSAGGALLSEAGCAALIPQRRNNSHKGTYGNVGIIGGSDGMVGAAVIAARAALHMGPGKVYVGLMAKKAMSFDAINPEIMIRSAAELVKDESITTFAIGMGMGLSESTSKVARSVMKKAIASHKSILIDADALRWVTLSSHKTISSTGAALQAKMAQDARPSLGFEINTVLTPHPGEAAQLLGISAADVQRDRIAMALSIARRADAIVVLKGAGTIIATPPYDGKPGQYFINTTGNPGMASGGMGDALSGMIAAFMAQGLSALNAAKLGVYLHGAAADAACHHGMGPNGLTASEVIFEARSLLNSGLADHHD